MRRIRALKKLQLESTRLEAQFYIEVQKLESKYLALNQPLFEKRRDIISGSHEPTDEEAHWSEDEDDEEEDVLAIKATGNQGNHLHCQCVHVKCVFIHVHADGKDNGTDVDGPTGAEPSKDGELHNVTVSPPSIIVFSPDVEPSTGIEEFWLTAFKNCEIFTDIIKVVVFEICW